MAKKCGRNTLQQYLTNTNSVQQVTYDAYSDSKYRFAVKNNPVRFHIILLLSDSTFFKPFFHIFAAVIEAFIVAGRILWGGSGRSSQNAAACDVSHYWQCHRVESLKCEESAATDQKLWNVCRHALFRWPYAPNHHSPKMDAHFAPHRARSLVSHCTSEPIS